MPLEWLQVLNLEGADRSKLLYDLKYKYTVSDVYDLMELVNVDQFYETEKNRLERLSHNANR
mgnify:FL=1